MNKIEKPSEKIETFTCRSCKRVLDLTERGAFSYSHGQVCVRCIERLSREREVNEKKERTVDNKVIKLSNVNLTADQIKKLKIKNQEEKLRQAKKALHEGYKKFEMIDKNRGKIEDSLQYNHCLERAKLVLLMIEEHPEEYLESKREEILKEIKETEEELKKL